MKSSGDALTALATDLRSYIAMLAMVLLTFCCVNLANAQQSAKVHRIGYLSIGSRSPGTDAFLRGLKDLGYIEGQNIAIEYRWAEGKEDRLSVLAAEIISLNPSAIVVAGSAAARAVQKLTKTIPVVIADSTDPVGTGLVKTLSKPGGNITGLTIMAPQLGSKRLELLKEVFPRVVRMAVVRRSSNSDAAITEMEVAAQRLGVQFQIIATNREASEIEDLFELLGKERVQAIVLVPSPMFTYQRKTIVALASKNRIPVIYPHRRFVEAGGLMSYAGNPSDLFRRTGSFVDKILKGANPGDLPMEGPVKFELVINLNTVKQLGVTIPPEILLEASELIQ